MIFLFPRWDMLIPWRVPTKTLLRFGPWPFPFQLRLQGDPFLKPITEPGAEFVTLALAWCFFWGDGVAKDGGWFSEFSGVHPPNKNRPKVLKSFIQSPEFSLTNYSPKDMCPVEVTYICRKKPSISPFYPTPGPGWMNSIAVFCQAFKSMDVSQDLGPAHVGPGAPDVGSFFGREIPETIQKKVGRLVKYDNLI